MRWVALIRNVMLGREGLHRAELLRLVEEAGGAQPRSILTTGNVTFSARERDIGRLTLAMESALQQLLGRQELVAVRSLDWLEDFIATDRFSGYSGEDCSFEVSFLSHTAPKLDPAQLGDPQRTVIVAVGDRELLTAWPNSGSARPHGNHLLERATGLQATTRGWPTLCRISAHG